jgi:hypothetical protein
MERWSHEGEGDVRSQSSAGLVPPPQQHVRKSGPKSSRNRGRRLRTLKEASTSLFYWQVRDSGPFGSQQASTVWWRIRRRGGGGEGRRRRNKIFGRAREKLSLWKSEEGGKRGLRSLTSTKKLIDIQIAARRFLFPSPSLSLFPSQKNFQ